MICLAPATLAQDDGVSERNADAVQTDAKRTDAKNKPCYRRLDAILDQDVRLTGTLVSDEDELPTVSVDDVLINPKTGEMRYFVLGFEDKQVLRHVDELTWNMGENCYDLKMTEEAVEALPAFDLEEALEKDLDKAVTVAEARIREAGGMAEQAVREASAPKKMQLFAGTNYVVSMPRFISGDSIDDLEVYSTTEKFGGVTDCIVDCKSNKVEFLIVSVGGLAGVGATDHLLPMNAVTLCRESEEMDSDSLLCTPLTIEQLKKTSEFEEDDEVCLTADAAKRARQYVDNIRTEKRPQ